MPWIKELPDFDQVSELLRTLGWWKSEQAKPLLEDQGSTPLESVIWALAVRKWVKRQKAITATLFLFACGLFLSLFFLPKDSPFIRFYAPVALYGSPALLGLGIFFWRRLYRAEQLYRWHWTPINPEDRDDIATAKAFLSWCRSVCANKFNLVNSSVRDLW